jgi:hypothetical protein
MEKMIIVEVGTFDDDTKSYQFYERLTNGTWKLAENLSDGKPNVPMYFRDARTRMAQMNTVKAYGGAEDLEI